MVCAGIFVFSGRFVKVFLFSSVFFVIVVTSCAVALFFAFRPNPGNVFVYECTNGEVTWGARINVQDKEIADDVIALCASDEVRRFGAPVRIHDFTGDTHQVFRLRGDD